MIPPTLTIPTRSGLYLHRNSDWLFVFFHFAGIPQLVKLQKSNHPWRALTVSAGEMGATELAGVSKIAKSVICPLADKGISVLVMSTYQSDYILVSYSWINIALSLLYLVNLSVNYLMIF